jgi:thiol-disulfide isomerase/thioredoxin
MTTEAQTSQTPAQQRAWSRLRHGTDLLNMGKPEEAKAELESALLEVREVPYEIEFETRIQLAMTLADVYYALDEIPTAGEMLKQEAAFAEKISQIMQITGTPAQKRSATGGFLQVKDRATQMALLGKQAPEIAAKTWINTEPLDLKTLRGRVVLLEFWATWCKPCQEMFPKLIDLYRESREDLEILALTRHYMAYRGTPAAMEEEVQLIRRTIANHGANFPVAVAEDEKLQSIYGANGLPTAFLIDRNGIVRYAGQGGDDPAFKHVLQRCISNR